MSSHCSLRSCCGVLACVATAIVAGCAAPSSSTTSSGSTRFARVHSSDPSLGNFSVSLAVKDLAASRAFYEALGFRVVGGDAAKNWLILQNDTSTIGLFQGMFDRNMLTFNPGWSRDSEQLPEFTDIREIQRTLRARGLEFTLTADDATTGPASLMLMDPDGNPILIDQHVARPAR